MKIGDCIIVKEGVKNIYIKKYNMGGCVGRVFFMFEQFNEKCVDVEFDSITIRNMTDKYIKKFIRKEIDYACQSFYQDDVEIIEPRDTPDEVKAARKEIKEKFGFTSVLDKEGQDVWSPKIEIKDDEDFKKFMEEKSKGTKQMFIPKAISEQFIKKMIQLGKMDYQIKEKFEQEKAERGEKNTD